MPGVETVRTDIIDADATRSALADLGPTHLFISAWVRQATEAENIAVNSAIVHNVIDVVGPSGTLRHGALVTGLEHYRGPFEAYGTGVVRDTPFHEDEPRPDTANSYYAQADELERGGENYGFRWSEHRSHTVIGHAVGKTLRAERVIPA